jgi:anti-sigma regulatory factor (Ser/Thr protein kinase)
MTGEFHCPSTSAWFSLERGYRALAQLSVHFHEGLKSEELDEVNVLIALQEALVNAVLHGCQNDPSKMGYCSVEIHPGALTIIVRDPGPGFDVDGAIRSSQAGANMKVCSTTRSHRPNPLPCSVFRFASRG